MTREIATSLLVVSVLLIGGAADEIIQISNASGVQVSRTFKQRQILQTNIILSPETEESPSLVGEEQLGGSPDTETDLDLDESLGDSTSEPPSVEASPVVEIGGAPGPEDDVESGLLADVVGELPSVEVSPAEEDLEDVAIVPGPEDAVEAAVLISAEPPSVEDSPEESLEDITVVPGPEEDVGSGLLTGDVLDGPPSVEDSTLDEGLDVSDGAPAPEADETADFLDGISEEPPSVEVSPMDESLEGTDGAPGPEDEVEAAFLDDISTESPAGGGTPLEEESPEAEMMLSEAPGPESGPDLDFDIDAATTAESPFEESPEEAIVDEPSSELPATPEPEGDSDIDTTAVDEQAIEAPTGESAGMTTFVAEMTFEDLNFDELTGDPARLQTFTGSISSSIAAASGVPEENVRVVDVRPGSVIVETEITVPEETGALDELSMTLQDPEIFDQAFTQEFGAPQVGVTTKPQTLDALPQQEDAGAAAGVVSQTIEGPVPEDEDHGPDDEDHDDDDEDHGPEDEDHDDDEDHGPEDEDHDDDDDDDNDHDDDDDHDDDKDDDHDDDHTHIPTGFGCSIMGLTTVLFAVGTAVMMPCVLGFY